MEWGEEQEMNERNRKNGNERMMWKPKQSLKYVINDFVWK